MNREEALREWRAFLEVLSKFQKPRDQTRDEDGRGGTHGEGDVVVPERDGVHAASRGEVKPVLAQSLIEDGSSLGRVQLQPGGKVGVKPDAQPSRVLYKFDRSVFLAPRLGFVRGHASEHPIGGATKI
jgi:hypothetical protein